MPLETTKFDIQDHLKTPEDRAAYLEAAFEEGDTAFITHALNDVARAITNLTFLRLGRRWRGGHSARLRRQAWLWHSCRQMRPVPLTA